MTPHFSIKELTRTDTGLPNNPGTDVFGANIQARLINVAMHLEHVRTLLGNRPLYITSGYRSPEVNAAVGGSPTSDHMSGYCVDFVPPMTRREAVDIISRSWLPFDQLINEPKQGIVHISFAPAFRRQILTRQGNRYLPGNLSV